MISQNKNDVKIILNFTNPNKKYILFYFLCKILDQMDVS
jgi:hypothetical protein